MHAQDRNREVGGWNHQTFEWLSKRQPESVIREYPRCCFRSSSHRWPSGGSKHFSFWHGSIRYWNYWRTCSTLFAEIQSISDFISISGMFQMWTKCSIHFVALIVIGFSKRSSNWQRHLPKCGELYQNIYAKTVHQTRVIFLIDSQPVILRSQKMTFLQQLCCLWCWINLWKV